MRYMLVALIVAIMCFILSPSIVTIIGVISGASFGFSFALFGMSDEEMQRLNKRKEY